MPSNGSNDAFAEEARKLGEAKELKLKQLQLAKQRKQAAEDQAAGNKDSAAAKAAKFGKGGPPPTAPKPFYKKFTIYVQTTAGTVAR
jgi:hypothetical protein